MEIKYKNSDLIHKSWKKDKFSLLFVNELYFKIYTYDISSFFYFGNYLTLSWIMKIWNDKLYIM